MKKIFALLLLLILIGGAFFIYRKYFTQPTTQVIESARVERGDIKGLLVETGIIKPQVGAVVKIGARATGTIVDMKVKIGDRVKKEQTIALIDDREIQKAIEQQTAALTSAQGSLLQVETTYPLRIREAKATLDLAQTTYERESELLKKGFTTKDAYDRARSQFDIAEAVYKRLQDEYTSQQKIARANIDDHAAQLKQQETKITYTRIISPIDGIVSDVTAQEGETIVAGLQVANLVTVLDPSLLEMWIYVDETDIGKVRIGQKVEYYVDTYPDRLFSGTVEKIYPQPVVKDNIVYYLSIVKVTRADAGFLKPEMTTHVKVIYSEKTGILAAPSAAVKIEKGKQLVYKVIGPNRVEKKEVKIGIRGEDKTEIVSGVSEGDELATKLVLPFSSKPENARK